MDWTLLGTALIASSSAIAGAALGYLTARRQAEAETERVRLEHVEEHLSHRQAVYHDFFDSAHRYHQAMSVEPFVPPQDSYQVWARQFEHRLVAVSLFGTEEAWRAAQRLAAVIYEAVGEPEKYIEKYEKRFLRAWDEAIEAMRLDTAPRG